jgi:hypothetical protein
MMWISPIRILVSVKLSLYPLGWMSLRDKGTLMALGISNNDIGELVQPPALGWTREGVDDGSFIYKHAAGREQTDEPKSELIGVIALSKSTKDIYMRTISSVDVLFNNIGTCKHSQGPLQSQVPLRQQGHNGTELDVSDTRGATHGTSNWVPKALSYSHQISSLKDNSLCNKDAWKARSEMMASNTVLKGLDVSENSYSNNCDGAGFAQELAVGLGDNGALTKLDISRNAIQLMQEGELRRICAGKLQKGWGGGGGGTKRARFPRATTPQFSSRPRPALPHSRTARSAY